MTARRSARYLIMCASLPPGHWHCEHGHLADCPSPPGCPRLVEGPLAFAVVSGRVCYLFTSESLAFSCRQVLVDGGAAVRLRRGLSEHDVAVLLAELADGIAVEDLR